MKFKPHLQFFIFNRLSKLRHPLMLNQVSRVMLEDHLPLSVPYL